MKYPIGIQDFRTLREGGYAYVDKTEHIHRLLTTGKYYFFSRPRRFGKSLTVATMNELYSGSKELFEGLWVRDHWDFAAMRRPVVWLKFAKLDYHERGLNQALHTELLRIGRTHGIALPEGTLKETLYNLLRALSEQAGRVVLLIDEYDKPIIDYLDDLPRAEENRETLKRFYSVLKDSDPYLELVFITGVSAFSKVSIFSDLNNIRNLSLTPLANTLVGITEAELTGYFADALQGVDRQELRRWYNGYSWTGGETVYNPFSLLNFLADKTYRNYWFETGTPTFLINRLRDTGLYEVSGSQATDTELINFDINNIRLLPLLFQTGYLTVSNLSSGFGLYTLDYPNLEVRQSLQEKLLGAYSETDAESPRTRMLKLFEAFSQRDIPTVIAIINATLAGVPYDLWRRDDEHIYHALVHLTFSLLGVYLKSEVHTARGRCDTLIETDDYIYAFEFKIDSTAEVALKQIEERGYLTPYQDDPREKIAAGISFDPETRQVGDWGRLSLPA